MEFRDGFIQHIFLEIPILDTGLGRFGFTQKKIASEATKIVGFVR